MKEIIKNNPKKITGAAIALAVVVNFGTISDELQEWFYMAKGEKTKPSSLDNPSMDKFTDKPDYFIEESRTTKQEPSKKK